MISESNFDTMLTALNRCEVIVFFSNPAPGPGFNDFDPLPKPIKWIVVHCAFYGMPNPVFS